MWWVWPWAAATTPLPLVLAWVFSARAKLRFAARPGGMWAAVSRPGYSRPNCPSGPSSLSFDSWTLFPGNEKPMDGPDGEPGGTAAGTAGRLEAEVVGPEAPPTCPRGRRFGFMA